MWDEKVRIALRVTFSYWVEEEWVLVGSSREWSSLGCVKSTMRWDTKVNYKYLSLAESVGERVKGLDWTVGFMDRSKGVCEPL